MKNGLAAVITMLALSVASIETVITSATFVDGGSFDDSTLAPEHRPRSGKR